MRDSLINADSISPPEWVSSSHWPTCERLLDNLNDAVYFVDTERRIMYWNQGATDLTGYSRIEAVGRLCFDNFLAPVTGEGCAVCFEACPLKAAIDRGERQQVEVYFRHKDRHRVPVSFRVAPITDNADRIIGAVAVFSDITAKRTLQRRAAELETFAFRDELTDVANRRYSELKIAQAIQECEQFDRSAGLLMIDIDRFKNVNDSYGHVIGDAVLKAVCNTLRHNLRPCDIVGRWGGEEFIILAMDVSAEALGVFAERCRMLIGQTSVAVSNHDINVTVSVGATLITKGDSVVSVIKRADEVQYKSKTSGRNRTTLG
jgi:diguanylate cyclase (GGDEF)-like protein/PAS domain S-box-containing protein